VRTASGGEQALAMLGNEHFDLVILDVLMPGIGGFETCRRIRATAALAELPVLFMTALGDRDATAPALDAGADDLLAKPFTRSELLLRASALIRQHQAVQKRRADTDHEREKILAAVHRLREISKGLDGDVAIRLGEELAALESTCARAS
jgi:putative two-component system response regulator